MKTATRTIENVEDDCKRDEVKEDDDGDVDDDAQEENDGVVQDQLVHSRHRRSV